MSTHAVRLGPNTSSLGLRGPLHYAGWSTRLLIKNAGFVLFSVGLPVLLYVLFDLVFGGTDSGSSGVSWAAVSMVSMATYGSLGAAMSGGAQLAVERRSGWFRQLSLTAVPARDFVWAKAGVIMIMVLPALILVFAAGALIGGVRAPATTWLASLGLMWLALVPMTMLGIVLGVWLKTEVVPGATTVLLLALSLLGGLWFPAEMLPSGMQHVAHLLPSYWVAALGRYPFAHGAFPWTGVLVLALWCGVLTVLGALGYRRAVASSRR